MLSLTIIPTHAVATWLLSTIDGMLNHIGLGQDKLTEEIIYIILISAISVAIGIGVKKMVLFLVQKAVALKHTELGTKLLQDRVLTKCSHIITPIVFMAMIPFAFNSESSTLDWILKIVGIYTLVAFAIGVSAIFRFIFDRYNEHENRRNLPLKGILNVAIGIVWIVILIIAVSILVGKSPGALLAGLGAFAAALMLIFKDSILGFVAGIQMSDNDMLHVGDWIVIPGTPANGIVQDVSLSTVKVQNFDLTTVMVPPYTLVSTSFQNYHSMYQAGARRIENSLIIDIPTVCPTTDEMLDTIGAKYPNMAAFIDNLRKNKQLSVTNPGPRAMNGTIETNLGLFRAYIGLYLNDHPKVAKDQRIMVRLMQATNSGVPLQIWCFASSTNWDEYEGIQSEIMEHLAAVINDFGGLAIYSSSSLTIEQGSTMKDSPDPAAAPAPAISGQAPAQPAAESK